MVQRTKELPRRCAGAIRTLKYIAIAHEAPRDYCVGWESADEQYGGSADEYEYQGEWYEKKLKMLRWWRVERSIKKRWRKTKFRPLTPEKGRGVQKFLEEADFDTIEHIDGKSEPCASCSRFCLQAYATTTRAIVVRTGRIGHHQLSLGERIRQVRICGVMCKTGRSPLCNVL